MNVMIQTDFGHNTLDQNTQNTITHLLEEINLLLDDNLFRQKVELEEFKNICNITLNENQHLLTIQNNLQSLLTYYIKIK